MKFFRLSTSRSLYKGPMHARFAVFQLVLGISLMAGAVTGRFSIRGFQYLPQTTAYRIVFFILGVISFCSGFYSVSHLHR